MKNGKVILILLSQMAFQSLSFAQTEDMFKEYGGAYPFAINNATHPCISPETYKMIEQQLADTKAKLNNRGYKTTATLFSWPLQAAAGLTDCSYYYIGNYIDEDTTAGIKDYNCGSVSYNGHRGTDICIAPYPFLKMDSNRVDVVAAAPGVIAQKSDGYFDKNCAMNSDTANYVIIQHADGSYALYWHMKKYSVTSKTVGSAVAAGEFLGVVGSSGSSTAPHLHFEVWSTAASSSLKDPWAGPCNSLGGVSWWAAQKPYTEPAILKVQVNNIAAVLPPCPATETPNEDTCFAPGAVAKFFFFLRNETPGDTVYERIINPGGSTFTSWTHNSTTSYLASYWYFNKTLPTTPGKYTYEASYNGITCRKVFYVDADCSHLGVQVVGTSISLKIFPNPASDVLHIDLQDAVDGNYLFTTRNTVGQQLGQYRSIAENNKLHTTIALSQLPAGVYWVEIRNEKTFIVRKFIKQE